MNIDKTLISTDFIDSDNREIVRFANEAIGSELNQIMILIVFSLPLKV
jgi:hypothetical protein